MMNRCRLGRTFLLAGVVLLFITFGLLNCSGSSSSDIAGGSIPTVDDSDPDVNQATPAVACEDDDQAPVGNIFFLNPNSGSISNDGSAEHPWSTLQEVVDNGMIQTQAYTDLPYDGTNTLSIKNEGGPVRAGDTLILLDGFHGEFNLRGAYNESAITIKAATGHRPMLSRIFLSAAANWRFEGVVISPSEAPVSTTASMVTVESHRWHGPSSRVLVENCELYSVEDASGWTMEQWDTLAYNAISVSGDCITVRDNLCRNVNFGISVNGNRSLVSGNTVENFAGDGLRGLGNDLVFEYNVVKNCYDVNANHDDGFQSWSINDDPPRERVVLRGNTFINYEDPNQPFRGTLQGIGCFDGPYVDWVVENNLVITDHWHGISLYGALNCSIVNNTVVDINNTSPGPPWIMVSPHKNGTPSQGCVIRNNIAATITATGNTVEDHNHLLTAEDHLFIDPDRFDYHLRAENHSPVIDQGSDDSAPFNDRDGATRPKGKGVDIGCYEY
jgi:hypothetical protein